MVTPQTKHRVADPVAEVPHQPVSATGEGKPSPWTWPLSPRGPAPRPGFQAAVFLLQSDSRAALRRRVLALIETARVLNRAGFDDLAVRLSGAPDEGPWRAALVARGPRQLGEGLEQLSVWLGEGRERAIDYDSGVLLGRVDGDTAPRIAFLFPGQAAPVHFDGGQWQRSFDRIDRLYRDSKLPRGGDPQDTAVAQPLIVAAQLAGLEALQQLGIRADLAIGHSLGELTALHWAGAWDRATLLTLVRRRGRLMARARGGAMCQIAAPLLELQEVLEPNPKVVVSCINGPDNTVVSGPVAALEAVACRARHRGWRATRLRIGTAFHSAAMVPAACGLEQWMGDRMGVGLRRRVISTVTAAELPPQLDLKDHLVRQMTAPVRFMEAMDRVASEVDLCIEVGSGRLLTGFAGAWMGLPVLALDVGDDSLDGLARVLATVYVCGGRLDKSAQSIGHRPD